MKGQLSEKMWKIRIAYEFSAKIVKSRLDLSVVCAKKIGWCHQDDAEEKNKIVATIWTNLCQLKNEPTDIVVV